MGSQCRNDERLFMWWKRKQPIDETLVQAHKLGRATMIDPSRIYFWALSHDVDLKAERKRLKAPGVLSFCVFQNMSLKQGEESTLTP